jgi:hypothetical protein
MLETNGLVSVLLAANFCSSLKRAAFDFVCLGGTFLN